MQLYESVRNSATAESKKAKWASQQQRVWRSLYYRPQTRLQIAHNEGIPIQNVCRYVASLRKAGHVHVVRVDTDPLSGMKAEYLSTSPAYRPGQQISMFNAP